MNENLINLENDIKNKEKENNEIKEIIKNKENELEKNMNIIKTLKEEISKLKQQILDEKANNMNLINKFDSLNNDYIILKEQNIKFENDKNKTPRRRKKTT